MSSKSARTSAEVPHFPVVHPTAGPGGGRAPGGKTLLVRPQGNQQRFERRIGSLIALMFVLLACVILALFYESDLILPGVEVLGLELGWKTKSTARSALEGMWRERTIMLLADGDASSVRAESLGILLDTRSTVESAHARGRSLGRIGALLRGEAEISVPPVVRLDSDLATQNLVALTARFSVSPTDATVRLAGHRMEAVPAIAGRTIDVAATGAWLTRHADRAAAEGRMPLSFAPVQPAVTDVSAVVDAANQWLSNSLAVRFYDPVSDEALVWSVPSENWNTWLTLQEDLTEEHGFRWTFRPEVVLPNVMTRVEDLAPEQYVHAESVVEAIEEALSTSRWSASARIYHYPSQHVVQLGETVASISRDYGMPYPWIQRENPGVGDSLRAGQVLNIPSPDLFLSLPVVEHKRIVVNIGQQTMWAYEFGAVKWAWPVSTGIESSPTSPGVFQIQSHDQEAYAGSWDLWMPYFMGIYYPAPGASVINGFHGFPTRGGTTLLWTGSLGHPVTFGCILVSTSNAALLYEWAEDGVVVEIQP